MNKADIIEKLDEALEMLDKYHTESEDIHRYTKDADCKITGQGIVIMDADHAMKSSACWYEKLMEFRNKMFISNGQGLHKLDAIFYCKECECLQTLRWTSGGNKCCMCDAAVE